MVIHLLIIQIVTFVILLLVLRQLFYKQLQTSLARLQVLHEQNVARESELKKKAAEIELERKEVLKKAQRESEKIIFDATISAAKVTSDMEEQSEGKAASMLREGRTDLERKEKEMLSRNSLQTIDQAVKIVSAAFSPGEKDVLHEYFLNELIAEINALDKATFVVSTRNIKVTTAYPVDDVKRQMLVRIISEKMQTDIVISFELDPEVIAGLIVHIGDLTIDGSLRNKLNKTAAYLKNHG
jgi:F0F1-type ATP synthase membrane subunit b/b'